MLALLLAASLQAQPAVLRPELQPLAFLAGSCWRATFPRSTSTDTHCFTAIHGGHFLRDRHVVAGAQQPYSGETLYRWDSGALHIRFDYYASDGSHSGGRAVPGGNGLVFPDETHRESAGAEMTIRSVWTWDGDNAYVVVSESLDGAVWREMWSMRFERIGPAPADQAD